MKKLISAITNRDGMALAKISGAAKREQERVINANAEKLVDVLFENLVRIFPASRQLVLRSPEDEAAMKRQWIVAFAENGITSMHQLKAGVRIARQQETNYWPSCGKFIAWCKDGEAAAQGLPDIESVMREFSLFNRTRYQYESPELFPWSHPVMYWIVLDMRRVMHQYNQTQVETEKTAKRLLSAWVRRVTAGEKIPTPAIQLVDKSTTLSVSEALDRSGEYRAKGAELLARIRGMDLA